VFEYQHGIVVRGINSHLTRAVTEFLSDAGYNGVRSEIQVTTLQPSAENWEQANAGLMVIVGHPESVT